MVIWVDDVGTKPEVTAHLVDEMPANFEAGLSAYGHRRKGDCQDIEMKALLSISSGKENSDHPRCQIGGLLRCSRPISDPHRQRPKCLTSHYLAGTRFRSVTRFLKN
jgi:hypothetical protein